MTAQSLAGRSRWTARPLRGGVQVVSIEANCRHARIAQAICRFAGVDDHVYIMVERERRDHPHTGRSVPPGNHGPQQGRVSRRLRASRTKGPRRARLVLRSLRCRVRFEVSLIVLLTGLAIAGSVLWHDYQSLRSDATQNSQRRRRHRRAGRPAHAREAFADGPAQPACGGV